MHYVRRRKRYVIEGHKGEGLTGLLKWQFGTRRAKWPKKVENVEHSPPPLHVYGDRLCATWIGHSTVLVQTAGLNILTDPFLSMRASPLVFAGPKRVRKPGLQASSMPPIDIVLVSHNHYDHLDKRGLKEILRDHSPTILTPLGNRRFIAPIRSGVDVKEMDWRQSCDIGSVRVTLTPALHWSKRTLDDANRSLWGAFVIETPGGTVYFAGDTGFGNGDTFREIRSTYGCPRLSLLPIGAYEPRWFMKAEHMNPDDAVMAHLILGSTKSLAIHHGTIQLTNEPIDQPLKDLELALQHHVVPRENFIAPDIGECLDIL
jgi:L-ascorbate metabolism protein UlaG (beta-lactamase superfamily)